MRKGETMPKSMTGFGRGEATCGGASVVCEIRTVNSKFLDVNSRLPGCGASFEARIKGILGDCRIARGKADVRLEVEYLSGSSNAVTFDEPLARAYLEAMNSLSDALGEGRSFGVRDVIGKPGVLTVTETEIPEEEFSVAAESALRNACAVLCEMRQSEGEKLMLDFDARLKRCGELLTAIEGESEQARGAYFSRLRERLMRTLEEYRVDADEQRILTECAIFADKVAIDEETVRLRSHIAAFYELAGSDEACGRKLDFLVQEMNREANTIGSKCSDASVARMVVELKNEIEKIREQVQNIE